jgi:hypothetical protein
MKRALLFCGVAILFFVLGSACTYLVLRSPSNTNRWIQVTSDAYGIGFNDKVVDVDFSLPKTKKPAGRIKFLNRDDRIQLGYMLTLPVESKPTSSLPEKYTRLRTLPDGTQIGPPDQVEYEGTFEFTLKDADGFVLKKLSGPKEYLTAGSQNQLQGTAEETIPPSIVERTKIVMVDFSATDCIPCDPQ